MGVGGGGPSLMGGWGVLKWEGDGLSSMRK